MIYHKPVQIIVDAPGLTKIFIDLVAQHNDLPNLILSDKDFILHLQVLIPAVLLSGLATVNCL